MELQHKIALNLPASSIDMERWIFSLTDSAYQSCAVGHLAMGMTNDVQGRGMINVETIGGVLLIQHYRVRTSSSQHFELVSEKSRAYVMHLFPLTVKVRWAMHIQSLTTTTGSLTCEIGVYFSNAVIALAATLMGLNFFLHRHLIEETTGFARNLQDFA